METSNLEQNKTNILQKIESGTLKAHSRGYFRFRISLLIILITVIFILSTFLCSFIIFNIRFSGQLSLIGFGTHGTVVFLKLFPWILFLVNALLIVIAGILIRSFRFGYKTPLIYLALGVIISMSFAGIFIDQATSLHYVLWQNAQKNSLPVFGKIYKHTCASPLFSEKIYRGTISTIENGFLTADIQSERCGRASLYKILLDNPKTIDVLRVGDNIFIEGEMRDGIIQAETVRSAPPLLGPLR